MARSSIFSVTAMLLTPLLCLSSFAQVEARGDRGSRQDNFEGRNDIAANQEDHQNRNYNQNSGFPPGRDQGSYERGFNNGYTRGYDHGYSHGYSYYNGYNEPAAAVGLGVGLGAAGIEASAGINSYENTTEPNVNVYIQN